MVGLWGLIFFLLRCAQGAEVCYNILGCFTDEAPWGGTAERPLGLLPMSPETINTHFFLFTKENPDNVQVISALDHSSLSTSSFNPNRKTYFIIHGFLRSAEDHWLMDMCKTLLKIEDVNCFCVDWRGGSRTLYTQAANNIRVVGSQLAYFINFLYSQYNYSPSKIHIIGHSLGSHTAGEVGKRVPGIGRLTGLDPAGPLFQNTPPEVRLDPTDADFVDVIHTDASPLIPKLGLGMSQLVGHLDFFPNGGETMPGCERNVINQLLSINQLWEETDEFLACSHLRSYKYYTDSILTPDAFVAFPSETYEAFKKGSGFPCPSTGCPLMGHYADLYGRGTLSGQSLYLNTGDVQPYARWRYMLTVKTIGTLSFMGDIKVALHGLKGNTKGHEIASGLINPGDTYTAFIDVEADVGPLTTLSFTWNKSLINLVPSTLGAGTISVQYGKDGQTYQFCGTDQVMANVLQNLTPCDSQLSAK
ncbi:inactive pancreatic lipase-related protein 1 [Xenopus laevis]|uniref:Triacylglycerol lipase n=2 Tax=Xenopus laevis TaxID=8355 RepID=A0A974CB23_XENLA|nr:inactive pancreatic lipase-related protein 1 [Xenopus laevis]OCT69731.1 hypothetical protein XELAEV_18036655mg [Xenopus laevis]